jgi:predicted unusual protein kinase regulating ubiquinone biosynthesis (AarF/ABC1/UbiB family)
MRWVKHTQDNVPSEFESPAAVKEYCRKVMREEMNLDFDDVFKYWDDVPLGIASIGQVHRATLHSGEVVAVKVQVYSQLFVFFMKMQMHYVHIILHLLN